MVSLTYSLFVYEGGNSMKINSKMLPILVGLFLTTGSLVGGQAVANAADQVSTASVKADAADTKVSTAGSTATQAAVKALPVISQLPLSDTTEPMVMTKTGVPVVTTISPVSTVDWTDQVIQINDKAITIALPSMYTSRSQQLSTQVTDKGSQTELVLMERVPYHNEDLHIVIHIGDEQLPNQKGVTSDTPLTKEAFINSIPTRFDWGPMLIQKIVPTYYYGESALGPIAVAKTPYTPESKRGAAGYFTLGQARLQAVGKYITITVRPYSIKKDAPSRQRLTEDAPDLARMAYTIAQGIRIQ